MKTFSLIPVLAIIILLTCGCTSSTSRTETTTTVSLISTSTTIPLAAVEKPKQLTQKGLGNDSIRNRGFYRDDEFIIIGVMQNPYNHPVSVKLSYTLYSTLNFSIGAGQPKSGDIVNGYLPAKGVMPIKINCGKIANVDKYKINLDLKQTEQKIREKFTQINSSGKIDQNTVIISGEVFNQGTNKSTNTRMVAVLYDSSDKAVDAIAVYTLPVEIRPNSTATYMIQATYPATYVDYLKKIDHYRLFIQNVYQPETGNTTITTRPGQIPIEIIGSDNNTEIKYLN